MEGAAPDPEGQSPNRNEQPRQSIDDGLNHSVLEQNHGFLDDTCGSGRMVDDAEVSYEQGSLAPYKIRALTCAAHANMFIAWLE